MKTKYLLPLILMSANKYSKADTGLQLDLEMKKESLFSDGFISISECCQYLLERKIKHQLTKNGNVIALLLYIKTSSSDLLSEVKRFFNKVDTDRNGKITLTEFFVKLPD